MTDERLAEAVKFVTEAMDGAWDELAETMGLIGWVYRDIPKCAPEAWQLALDTIGDGNFQPLAVSHGSGPQGPWSRGQMFISPEGMRRLTEFSKGRKP